MEVVVNLYKQITCSHTCSVTVGGVYIKVQAQPSTVSDILSLPLSTPTTMTKKMGTNLIKQIMTESPQGVIQLPTGGWVSKYF